MAIEAQPPADGSSLQQKPPEVMPPAAQPQGEATAGEKPPEALPSEIPYKKAVGTLSAFTGDGTLDAAEIKDLMTVEKQEKTSEYARISTHMKAMGDRALENGEDADSYYAAMGVANRIEEKRKTGEMKEDELERLTLTLLEKTSAADLAAVPEIDVPSLEDRLRDLQKIPPELEGPKWRLPEDLLPPPPPAAPKRIPGQHLASGQVGNMPMEELLDAVKQGKIPAAGQGIPPATLEIKSPTTLPEVVPAGRMV